MGSGRSEASMASEASQESCRIRRYQSERGTYRNPVRLGGTKVRGEHRVSF